MKSLWPIIFISAISMALILPLILHNKNNSEVLGVVSSTIVQESAYDRIISSKKIRCGYVNYGPGSIKNPTTGEIEGIAVDVIKSAANQLGFVIEWVEETTWGLHLEGLKTGRYDVLCSSSFALPSDALWSETVGPLYYSTIGVWVRGDDRRFINNYEAMNRNSIKIAAIDGTIPFILAKKQFPEATIVSQPQFTDYSLNMLNVLNGKADVTFVEAWQGNAFSAQNSNKLVNIGLEKPLRTYHNYMLVRKGEFKLQTMLNTVIEQMHHNNEIEQIISRYEGIKGSLLRVKKPY